MSKRALVSFSIGTKYRDNVWCDVVAMDACHLLLGPWQFDREVIHNGKANIYSFMFEGAKIVLVPNKEHVQPKQLREDNKGSVSLLTLS